MHREREVNELKAMLSDIPNQIALLRSIALEIESDYVSYRQPLQDGHRSDVASVPYARGPFIHIKAVADEVLMDVLYEVTVDGVAEFRIRIVQEHRFRTVQAIFYFYDDDTAIQLRQHCVTFGEDDFYKELKHEVRRYALAKQ